MLSNLYVRQISLPHPLPADCYFSHLPVVQSIRQQPLELTSPVTFFVGENGVGKSTLIEAIAVSMGFNPEGGSRNFRFSTQDTHSALSDSMRIAKGVRPKDGFFLRAESFYNVATNIDELDADLGGPRLIDGYGGVSLHQQSHGESFMSLIENRLNGDGLYIFDEPEAALSPSRILRLMRRIHELTARRSQFIISTHSPILMAFPGATVFEITPQGVAAVPYQETEHYQVSRLFFDDPDRMLYHLFHDDNL